jgi:hypothetical protein
MAQVYYGVNRGKNFESAAVGTSTNSTDVEIRIDTSKVFTREEAYEAIEQLESFILQNVYPYA